MSHSILLIQPSSPETRTYSDYESVNDCLEGVCRIYEEHLKRRNPNTVSNMCKYFNDCSHPGRSLCLQIRLLKRLIHRTF